MKGERQSAVPTDVSRNAPPHALDQVQEKPHPPKPEPHPNQRVQPPQPKEHLNQWPEPIPQQKYQSHAQQPWHLQLLWPPRPWRTGMHGPQAHPLPCIWHHVLILRSTEPDCPDVLAIRGTRKRHIRTSQHDGWRNPPPSDLGSNVPALDPEEVTTPTAHRCLTISAGRGLQTPRPHPSHGDPQPRHHCHGGHRLPKLPSWPRPPIQAPPHSFRSHTYKPDYALGQRHQHADHGSSYHQDQGQPHRPRNETDGLFFWDCQQAVPQPGHLRRPGTDPQGLPPWHAQATLGKQQG